MRKTILIVALIVMFLWSFENISFAFDDWVSTSEACTPGASDYTGYLNYLWKTIVQDRLDKAAEEQDKALEAQKPAPQKTP